MKKVLILMLAFALAALLCACSLSAPASSPSDEATVADASPQAHTIAPATQEEEEELEWCPIEECELRFDDDEGNTVLNQNDITQFAISPDRSEPMLIFALSDQAKEVLSTVDTETFTLSVNGVIVGTAHTTVEGNTLVLTEVPREYDRICEVANMIRGLK